MILTRTVYLELRQRLYCDKIKTKKELNPLIQNRFQLSKFCLDLVIFCFSKPSRRKYPKSHFPFRQVT